MSQFPAITKAYRLLYLMATVTDEALKNISRLRTGIRSGYFFFLLPYFDEFDFLLAGYPCSSHSDTVIR